MMNNYLLMLGNNFSEVRQILNLTQEDLANKMGVSRPTIVKLEQDPSRLTKTLAFAFFLAISHEMQKRTNSINELNPKDYKNLESVGNFVDEVKKASMLSAGSIVTIGALAGGLNSLVPGIGKIIATVGTIGLVKSLKNKVTDEFTWDEEKAKKIIDGIKKKLLEDQNKILNCFQLTSFDTFQFVSRVEEGESFEE